jgi:hypothetical protein
MLTSLSRNFNGSGWINQLPTQKAVPGFKRIVMMKYFVDHNGEVDGEALWAYEGVVLPGDQIIVGRWWSAEAPRNPAKVYSGPFLLWNTDCSAKYQEVHESSTPDQPLVDAANLIHG